MEHLRSGIVGVIARRDHLECMNDDGFWDENLCEDVPFWWTRTGVIVKWALFLGLTTILFLYLLIGYLHAKSRMNKGLAPLGYHRFLVARRDLARVDPRYQYPAATAYPYYPNQGPGQGPAYGMHTMPPPPVYDPNAPRPPVYQYDMESGTNTNMPPPPPPPGATKIDPSQNQAPVYRPADHQQAEEYDAPPGPPPSNMPAQNTGNTNPFRG
ncbi:hypothetical protein QBC37DRAFT_179715 [Rhypophila decipiens]|uniref:Uncharacterized protein n=1 Tax=Rhypophila decipiens TaxID=261697 RepID=A0AAN6YMC3_9PEZI|nr:hypothetical protein QBC37DRAFT_179715 [Rhypophila decipiens]